MINEAIEQKLQLTYIQGIGAMLGLLVLNSYYRPDSRAEHIPESL